MKDLKKRIEELQTLLKKHRSSGFKELPTRTIFIDPLIGTLGWDVRDPDEVQLEYPTIDGKSVDYALKINGKPVVFLEAKALDDSLDDVKAITQVVGYAANEGVSWCVLTNGIVYRVYSSAEIATAPKKLLFQVSIDPKESSDITLEQIAALLHRLSRDSMAAGVLDEIGEEVFTTAKVRKALDRLFLEHDDAFVKLVRKSLDDDKVSPTQIRGALARLWHIEGATLKSGDAASKSKSSTKAKAEDKSEFDEAYHLKHVPLEVVELYRGLDKLCQDCAPGKTARRYMNKYVGWAIGTSSFCTVHIYQSRLAVWLKLQPRDVQASFPFIRDVSHVGHWGLGNVEVTVDNQGRLQEVEPLIRMAFEAAAKSQ